MSNILEEILVLLKKKKTIGIIIGIVVAIILMNILISINRDSIRKQQIDSVAKTTYQNKQFKSVQEDELTKLLTNKQQTIVGIVEPADNKGYNKVKKMFNKKSAVKGLPKEVYIYQPIYDSSALKKELKLNEKNTFLVIEDGQEVGRYSFNDLSIGYEEIVEEVDTILNPKILRKNPIRIEAENEEMVEEASDDGLTHTSEVTFE